MIPPEPLVWSLSDPVLRLREHGSVAAENDLVAAVDPAAWADLGLTVRRGPSERYWTVSASQYAGVARVMVNGRPVHLEITPKIDDLDLFFLADWAYSATDAPHRPAPAQLEVLRPDPAACVLGWYLQALIDFGTRWLRRGYVLREEELVGRVRGRIVVGRYTQQIAMGRAQTIPCRYAEPTHDTPLNQFLKAGLRRALSLVPSLPVAQARQHLQRMGTRALSLFGAVADVRATVQDVNRLSPSGPYRHYRPLVDLTRAVLAGTHLSPNVGRQVHHTFIYDLNLLFQEALRNILRAWPGATLDPRRASAKLVDARGKELRRQKVLPDYVLRLPGGTVALLDAKYTDVRAGPSTTEDLEFNAGHQRFRFRPSEVYQAVSYGQHDRWRPAPVALIYPVSLQVDERLPKPLQLTGFGPPVKLLFLDVGPLAHSNISAFHDMLGQAVRHTEAALVAAP